MSSSSDIHPTASAEDDHPLDPREAAVLLERTEHDARRKLTYRTPLLSVMNGVVVLVIYGAIWQSTRGHHPYRGPSLSTIGLVYSLLALALLVFVSLFLRATAGVSGRSQREARVAAVPVAAAIIGVYAFDVALHIEGFGPSLTSGLFDSSAPWLVLGAVLAALAVAKEDWWQVAGGIAMIAVAVGSVFAGPADAWGILAVGGCVLLFAQGAVRVRGARRS